MNQNASEIPGDHAASVVLERQALDQRRLERLAQLMALKIRPGWVVCLTGDLGVGKSTFARALIRALLSAQDAEVPSPTFSLVQSYTSGRVPLYHYDLYRLSSSEDIVELGLDEALAEGAVLIEWPERAEGKLPGPWMSVTLAETPGNPGQRDVRIDATSTDQASALARIDALDTVLDRFEHNERSRGEGEVLSIQYLQGDASPRGYARIKTIDGGESAILMDAPPMPDGPPVRNGKPYSRLAHLAEDVGPFIAIDDALRRAGLSAPEILLADAEAGVLVLEDLGDRVFGREVAAAGSEQERCAIIRKLWGAAADALAALRLSGPPPEILSVDGLTHRLAVFDTCALAVEAELLLDWFWPASFGSKPPAETRASFEQVWAPVFAQLASLPRGWVLRDFHSPNLLWLADRKGIQRVGIIDFQDAMQGHWAYDLVSLLQDARLEIPRDIERDLFETYCTNIAACCPAFDQREMDFAYAAFGAQRATKVIGIFARLAVRDGKPQYLQHLPRLWRTLEHNLQATDFAALRDWFDSHIPPEFHTQGIADKHAAG